MASFTEALKIVLDHEGGFTNDPNDSGGPTNWGITQADYSEYKGRRVSADEVRAMPLDAAREIYSTRYGLPLSIDQMRDQWVAMFILDQAVNRGVRTVVKQVQDCLSIASDGVLGPLTLAAINNAPVAFVTKLVASSYRAYVEIVLNNPSQIVFLRGWLNRLDDLVSRMPRD